MDTPMTTGRCLCGAVRFEVRGPLRDVIACHCEQCRRTSGHHVAATAVRPKQLTVTEASGLAWYASSAHARRGFCRQCGSSLFFEHPGGDRIAINAGALDDSTGLQIAAHIFVEEVPAYYTPCDAAPKVRGYGHSVKMPDE